MGTKSTAPVGIATVLASLVSVPATYALLRAYEVAFRTEPDPARVVWSPHIAVFWRLTVAGYVAGLLAPLVYMGAVADAARVLRGVATAVLVAALLLAVQGLAMP